MKPGWLLLASTWVVLVSLGVRVWQEWPDREPQLVVCDVGQGDAILFSHYFHQVLIDSGPDAAVVECLQRHVPFWDRTIEVVIATHADTDHIGGMAEILEHFATPLIIYESAERETDEFMAFERLVSRKQSAGELRHLEPQVGQAIALGPLGPPVEQSAARLAVLWPQQAPPIPEGRLWDVHAARAGVSAQNSLQEKGSNNRSIVLLLQVYDAQVLLTGDLEAPGEAALLAAGVIPPVDIIKIGHHGSKTSTTAPFLAQARPEIALISAGKNNRYGHPAPVVIERIAASGAQVLQTAKTGDLQFTFRPSGYRVNSAL